MAAPMNPMTPKTLAFFTELIDLCRRHRVSLDGLFALHVDGEVPVLESPSYHGGPSTIWDIEHVGAEGVFVGHRGHVLASAAPKTPAPPSLTLPVPPTAPAGPPAHASGELCPVCHRPAHDHDCR